jgi:ABC-2 type transport system permease protein
MNNKMIRLIAWHEYSTNVRRPGFIFGTLIFPALGLIGLIVATFFSGQATNILRNQFTPDAKQKIGVVDATRLYVPIEARFASRFEAFDSEEAAKGALAASQVAAVIVVPADYVQTGVVTIYSRNANFNAAIVADSATINPFLINGLLKAKVDEATLARVNRPMNATRLTLDADAKEQKPAANDPRNVFSFVGGIVISYAVALLLFAAIFSSANYLLRSISEEKENRVIEVLISSVSPMELLTGKVLGLGALGLTQMLVWIASAVLLSGGLAAVAAGVAVALSPMTFALAAIYFVLGYLLYAIIMATAGSLGTSVRESQQIAGLFSFFASIPWMINGFLFTNPNVLIARVLSYFPLTAPVMMMLRLALGQPPIEDIIGSIVVMIITIPIFLWGGAKIFRTSLLMYGKRLSVKEIWKVVRSA